ncbi:MAG: Primosomal protein, partial [Bacteroidota bacterium]|nr:Primosomal protein [Bacteroidota bacterium]
VPSIYKIRGYYRRIIILKNLKNIDPGGKILRKALSSAVEQYSAAHSTSSVKYFIDIDSMLEL